MTSDFDAVPIIDFSGMLHGTPSAKAQVASALREACTSVGFFYIVNHGVAQGLIARMFEQCPRFFALPLEQKLQLHVRKSQHYVGYVAMEDEKSDPALLKGDLHEGFDFIAEDVQVGAELWPGDFRRVGNQWPAHLPGFREVMTEYSIVMRRLTQRMFSAFALALGLSEDYFSGVSDRPMMLVRILHYPSTVGSPDEARMGTGAHTDHECFTILCQDDVRALQVRNRRGDWIDAPPIPGAFIVNIGDLMARWTNGAFASTPHRVANRSRRARYSIPCFVGANADAVIEALPNCCEPDNPPKYPPVVCGEYITNTIYEYFSDAVKRPRAVGAGQ